MTVHVVTIFFNFVHDIIYNNKRLTFVIYDSGCYDLWGL